MIGDATAPFVLGAGMVTLGCAVNDIIMIPI